MLPKKKQLSGAETRRKKKESDPKILPLKDYLNKFFTSSSNVDVIEEQGQETTPEETFFEALKYYCCRWSQSNLVLI